MDAVKHFIERGTQVVEFSLTTGAILGTAGLQALINEVQMDSKRTMLQTALTFLGCVLMYIGATHVHDNKLKTWLTSSDSDNSSSADGRDVRRVRQERGNNGNDNQRESNDAYEMGMFGRQLSNRHQRIEQDEEEEIGKHCMYSIFACGELRKCLFAESYSCSGLERNQAEGEDRERANGDQQQRGRRRRNQEENDADEKCCLAAHGYCILLFFALVVGIAVEACQLEAINLFHEPTYHNDEELEQKLRDNIQKLALARTILYFSVFTFALVLPLIIRLLSFLLALILLWPCFFCVYHAAQQKAKIVIEANQIAKQQEDRNQVVEVIHGERNGDESPRDGPIGVSDVHHANYAESEARPIAISRIDGMNHDLENYLPNRPGLDQASFQNLANIGDGQQEDVITQIRNQSVNIRIYPTSMISEIKRLQVEYKPVASQSQVQAENDQSSECSICLLKFKEKEKVVPLACNSCHVFHPKCITKWAHHSYTCPICRQSIIKSEQEIASYQRMQHSNLLNQFEDDLGEGVVQS